MESGVRQLRVAALGSVLLAALVAVLLGAAQASARQTGGNLLQNGDAEADIAPISDTDVEIPTGWQVTGAFTVEPYGTRGFPASPDGGGANLFAGGSGSAVSTASQTVDVSTSAAEIDAGAVRVTLSALLGGWESQEDAATVRAVFVDSTGLGEIGSFKIGPVSASDRGGKTVMLARSATAAIPARTRRIRVVITAQRSSGVFNDGYADNVALSLSSATPAQGRYAFGLRVFDPKADLSAGTKGTFLTRGQPDEDGMVSVVSVSARDLKLSWRYRGGRYVVVLGFRGSGSYEPAYSALWLRLVVKSSNVPRCRRSSPGSLRLNRPGDVVLVFCGDRVEFLAPSRASGWVAQR